MDRRTDKIDALYAIIVERMRRRTTAEWRERFDHFDVPNGVVTGLEGLLVDPYLAETGFFEHVQHPSEGKLLTMAIPVAFSATPGQSFRLPPPHLGGHTGEVLGELGYSATDIEKITRSNGVTADRNHDFMRHRPLLQLQQISSKISPIGCIPRFYPSSHTVPISAM